MFLINEFAIVVMNLYQITLAAMALYFGVWAAIEHYSQSDFFKKFLLFSRIVIPGC